MRDIKYSAIFYYDIGIVLDHCNAIKPTWYPQYAITKAHKQSIPSIRGKGKCNNYVGQVRSTHLMSGRHWLVTQRLRPPCRDTMRVCDVISSVQILWILWPGQTDSGQQQQQQQPSLTSEVTKPETGDWRLGHTDLRPGLVARPGPDTLSRHEAGSGGGVMSAVMMTHSSDDQLFRVLSVTQLKWNIY